MRTIHLRQPRCAIVAGIAVVLIIAYCTVHLDDEGRITFSIFRITQVTKINFIIEGLIRYSKYSLFERVLDNRLIDSNFQLIEYLNHSFNKLNNSH